jgi:hypothetical protein
MAKRPPSGGPLVQDGLVRKRNNAAAFGRHVPEFSRADYSVPSKKLGRDEQAPLTPEYQKVFEAGLAD